MISNIHSEVRRMIDHDEGGAEDIARLVEQEQSVSLVVLHAANVAFYSPSRVVKSVNRAIALLGLNSVAKLVQQAAISTALRPLAPPHMAPFWRHAYSCAQASRLLSVATRTAFPEEAFTAALMLRVGQALLMVKFPEAYEEVLDRMRDPEADLLEVENQVFGATQVDMGYLLTRRWRLTDLLVKLVLHQFGPEQANEHAPFAIMLYLADSIVSGLGIGSAASFRLRNNLVRSATWKKLGWNQMAFEPLCRQVVDASDEFDGFYALITDG